MELEEQHSTLEVQKAAIEHQLEQRKVQIQRYKVLCTCIHELKDGLLICNRSVRLSSRRVLKNTRLHTVILQSAMNLPPVITTSMDLLPQLAPHCLLGKTIAAQMAETGKTTMM